MVGTLAALLWPSLAVSVSDKTYTAVATASPAVAEDDAPGDTAAEVWAGATPQLSVTITNTSPSPQTLGSVNVTIPAGITPVVGTATISSTQSPFAGTIALSGSELLLRDLDLEPGRSVTAGVDARVTCAPAQPAYALATAAKQSNDFNGVGNDFALSGPPPALDAVGACTLAFSAQPASAQRETDITSEVYLPFDAPVPGSPVEVAVRDGSGAAPVTWWTAPVTLALASNPGSATLHGTVTVTPVAGVAGFKDPSAAEPGPRIGVSASGYRLSASSAGIAASSLPSSPFDVVDVGKRCTGGVLCPGASSSARSRAQVEALATSDGDILRLSLGAVGTPAPACAGYTPSTDVLDFDLTTPSGVSTGGQRTIVFTLLAPYVTRPASKYDACFQSTLPFVTRSGAPSPSTGGGYYTGLLPDCARRSPVAPCEVGTDRARSGDIVMTLIAPPADPRARF